MKRFPSRAADCTHIAAHCAAINNLYCNNSNQLSGYLCMCTAVKGICATMRVCPLREIIIYIKISLRRSAAMKQICAAMRRSAAIIQGASRMIS